MATSYSPKVVTDGLVMYLDAGNRSSYPGTGTAWTDISRTSNDVTLTGSPAFSETNSGILTFSQSSSQYGETASSLSSISNWTAEAWVKFTTVPSANSTVSALVTNAYNGSNLNFALTTSVDGSTYPGIYAAFYNGAWRAAGPHISLAGVWYQYCGTYDGATIRLYINGVLGFSTAYVGTASSGGVIRVARRWDSTVTAANLINGAIPTVRVYNRALAATEVLQNFNATKGRYGL